MKQRNKVTRLVSLLLTATLLLTACGQTSSKENKTSESQSKSTAANEQTSSSTIVEEASPYPEYLNLESAYPVIKEEYEGKYKLKVAMVVTDEAGKWEDLWVAKYLKDKYNIELEVEYINQNVLAEKKQLMLNSGELPDIMINMKFATDELVKYGTQEGLFLAMDEYIDETLTPSISYYMNDAVRRDCKATDGHIYSLPKLREDVTVSPAPMNLIFINKGLLDALNIEMPRTLDQFIDAMYAIKENDPAGVGKENLYPFGSGMEARSCTWYLLNALGYNLEFTDCYGYLPCVRDGEVVIPVYDMDIYKEFLTILNSFYKDGIIDPDFFTLESAEVKAKVAAGEHCTLGRVPYVSGAENFTDWGVGYPLTSEWQDEPETYHPTTVTVGGCVVSADTKYPELCMRFLDIYFNNQTDASRAFHCGIDNEPFNYEGYNTSTWDYENGKTAYKEPLPEGVNSLSHLLANIAGIQPEFGAWGLTDANVAYARQYGAEYVQEPLDRTNGEGAYRLGLIENQLPYLTDESFPAVYYTDPETQKEITRLKTVLEPYVKEQVAAFVVGKRPLSEVDKFKEELKGMGMEKLLNIYKDIYAGVQ